MFYVANIAILSEQFFIIILSHAIYRGCQIRKNNGAKDRLVFIRTMYGANTTETGNDQKIILNVK